MNVERARMDLAVAGVGVGGGGAGRSAGSSSSAGRSRKGKEKEKEKDMGAGKTVPAKRRASTAGFHPDDKPPSRKGKEKERFHPPALPTQKPTSTTVPTSAATAIPSSPPSLYDPPPPSDPLDPSESIQCICGFAHDDGFSIACDRCGRWCHAACFAIDPQKVPESWMCWECEPREVDRDAAVRIQRAQWKVVVERGRRGTGREKRSPGVERKKRGEGHVRKKRRISVVLSPTTATTAAPALVSVSSSAPVAQEEDDLIDIDEPWTHSYVPITNDIVPPSTLTKLRKHAQNWRGISAIAPLPPITPSPVPVPIPPVPPLHSYESQIRLLPLPPQSAPYLPPESTAIRPPAYAVHTAHPIPAQSLITPYTSYITPSSKYLSDPLNGYAHLGMPRPFVHLFGPPLDLALDARVGGGKSRFVRSGCRPNAVLRPVLCKDKGKTKSAEEKTKDTGLSFGVFAIRDLKANEEVVLGWEWDDGCAVHSLPAVIESPDMFPFPLCPTSFTSNSTSNSTPTARCTPPPTPTAATATATPPETATPPPPTPPSATLPTHCDNCGARISTKCGSTTPNTPPPLTPTTATTTTAAPPPTTSTAASTTAPPPPTTSTIPPTTVPPPTTTVPPTPAPPSTTPYSNPLLSSLPFPPHSPPTTQHSPHHLAYLKQQMANILHLLASTFTTCACGAKARDCALMQMSAFVEGEMVRSEPRIDKEKVDLGPLIGAQRGFRTRERVLGSGGVGGVEMVEEEEEEEVEEHEEEEEGRDLEETEKETEAERTETEREGKTAAGRKKKARRKKKRRKGVKRKVRVDEGGEEDGEKGRRIRIQTPSPSPSPSRSPSPTHAHFRGDAETMDVDVEDWVEAHEEPKVEVVEEEEEDPFLQCTLPPKMQFKRSGYVVSPIVPASALPPAPLSAPPTTTTTMSASAGAGADVGARAGGGLGLGLLRGDGAEGEEDGEEEHEGNVTFVGEVEAGDEAGVTDEDDESESPHLARAAGDGRPISFRRKDLLVREWKGADGVDSAHKGDIAVAGPSTSKHPHPLPPSLPPKLALVSPVTGAYGIIGSNRTTIADAVEREKDKEKEIEAAVDNDVDMGVEAGSPQMGWSPFTRKPSIEVQPAPASAPEEEEEEDVVPSTPSTHIATFSPHNHPPIPSVEDIEMDALDIPLTTQINESPLSSIHSPPPLCTSHHPQTPISPLSPGAPSQCGFASDAPLSPLTPATSAHHSSLPPPPFEVNGHGEDGFEQSMSPLSQISSSPVGGALVEAEVTPKWTPEDSIVSPLRGVPAGEEEAREGEAVLRESPAPDVVVRSPSPPRLGSQPSPPCPEPGHLAPSLPPEPSPQHAAPSPPHTELQPQALPPSPPQAEPQAPAPPPSPPPPPPPKVKLSLKDFALRKKKQREERERGAGLASPMSASSTSVSAFASPSVTNETIALSPLLGGSEVLGSEAVGRSEVVAPSPSHAGTNEVLVSESVESVVARTPAVEGRIPVVEVTAYRVEERVKTPEEEVKTPGMEMGAPREEERMKTPVVGVAVPSGEDASSVVRASPALDSPATPHSPPSPAPDAHPAVVLNGRGCSEESRDMDIDDSRPSSEQPEQQVVKPQDERLASPPKVNGYHLPPLSSSALHNSKPSLPSPPRTNVKPVPTPPIPPPPLTHPIPPPPLTHALPTPPLTHDLTLEAKIELVEHAVPPGPSPPLPPIPLHSVAAPPIPISSLPVPKDLPKRPISAAHAPPMSDIPLARRISQHEEGEIEGTPPPLKRYVDSYRPGRSPPTHPRSLRPPPVHSYRSNSFSSSSGNTMAMSRPVPSAPRALRNGFQSQSQSQSQSPSSYHPPPPRYTGSSYIPRGPSADRDRPGPGPGPDRDRGDRWPPPSRRGWRR